MPNKTNTLYPNLVGKHNEPHYTQFFFSRIGGSTEYLQARPGVFIS